MDTDSPSLDALAARPGRAASWIAWIAIAALATAAMLLLRARLDKAHIALIYLMVVLGGSARAGRRLGLALAAATFVAFNVFFLRPYGTLHVDNALDLLVLLTYLVTAGAVAQLLDRAEREATERLRLGAIEEHARGLREADRLKDSVITALSHDLRTPLTTIRALAHDIASEGDDRALAVAEEADRLTRLVQDLLDLSHLRAGALPVRPELNAVEDVLGAAIQQTSGVLGGRELRAGIDTREPVLLGRFDFVHTLRVLVNLIENAGKYSPPGEPIDVDARRRGGTIVITVADRGPGVAESERARIFEPYYRAAGVAGHDSGAGLGLAIALGLAQAQHGALTLAPREGGGSVFALTLPAADLPDLPVPAP